MIRQTPTADEQVLEYALCGLIAIEVGRTEGLPVAEAAHRAGAMVAEVRRDALLDTTSFRYYVALLGQLAERLSLKPGAEMPATEVLDLIERLTEIEKQTDGNQE